MTRIAGFGFRKETGINSLLDALMMAGGATKVTALATVDGKQDAACLQALAERLNLPIHAIPRSALEGIDVPTVSQKSLDMYGTGSVSEAAALIAAGPKARLITKRTLSADHRATCAIAEKDAAAEGDQTAANQGPKP